MTVFMTAALLTLAIAGAALVAGPATAAQDDTYLCETKYAIAISSAGFEPIDNVTFEFTWDKDRLHVSSGWMLTEFENFFEYSYTDPEEFSARSLWGHIIFDATTQVMTVYVPRANEMYSYWATCSLR